MPSFRRFVLLAATLLGLVAGGAWGVQAAAVRHAATDTDCARDTGTPLLPLRETADADGARRTLRAEAPAAGGGLLVLCVGLGDVEIRPSPDDQARVTWTVTMDGRGAARSVAATEVEVRHAPHEEGDRLVVTHLRQGLKVPFMKWPGAAAHVVVELPAGGAWRVAAAAESGDVTLRAVGLADVDARVGAGRISLLDTPLAGSATLTTLLGDVEARPGSLAGGALEIRSGGGDVDVHLPQGPAYDVRAEAEVGVPRIDVWRAEAIAPGDGSDKSVRAARTPGYADAPVRVSVRASTGVGDVTVRG